MFAIPTYADLQHSLATYLMRFRSLPFYLIALLLHLLFFLIFGTYEVTHRGGGEVISVFSAPAPVAAAAPNVPPPPPPPPREERNPISAALPKGGRMQAITTVGAAGTAFYVKSAQVIAPETRAPDRTSGMDAKSKLTTDNLRTSNLPAVELRRVLTRASSFVRGGTGVSGTGRSTRAKFQCYWAIYQRGDWNCNPTALPNMMNQIARWSRDRIQQRVEPQPIVVSSKDLFTVKPPFIFITGHKDFTFTEEEIENLRQYLHAGGAIWADNDLPGRRSRFDMAFRREMKRVLTDRDFERLPETHPIMYSYFTLRELPSGVNFYREPIEVVRLIADEIAIVYTLNAYGDMWESALDENDRIDRQLYRTGPRSGYYKWGPHFGNYFTHSHYRNINDETVPLAYKLGINIVVHLLTRYDDRLRAMGIQPGS
jgi:hypothetical protein